MNERPPPPRIQRHIPPPQSAAAPTPEPAPAAASDPEAVKNIGIIIGAFVFCAFTGYRMYGSPSGDFLYEHWQAAGNQSGGGVVTELVDSKLIKQTSANGVECSLGWLDINIGVSGTATTAAKYYVLVVDQGGSITTRSYGKQYAEPLKEVWEVYKCPGAYPGIS